MRRIQQQGIVLVLVLWMIVLLTVIALSYSQSSRTETLSTANVVNQIKAMATAEAGIHLAINDLLKPEIERDWTQDGQVFSTQFNEAEITLSIRNTAGLIDINTAPAELFSRLFNAVEPESDNNSVIDAILDWRDRDNIQRAFGAEEIEYQRNGLTLSAKNGAFNTINELRNVLGMTNRLYQQVAPYLTVHSQHSLVNPNYADEKLLYLLTGTNDADFNDQDLSTNKQALSTFYPALFKNVKRNSFKITSIASINSSKARLDAVILLAPQGENPYTLLSWKRNEWLATQEDNETVE